MYNINKDNEEIAWIDFSEDERYLVRWLSQEKIINFTNDKNELTNIDNLIDYIVKDWEGIFQIIDNKDVKLECTFENKKLVFNASPSRWGFVWSKVTHYQTFFNIEKYEKN